jgi:hypothetical protein
MVIITAATTLAQNVYSSTDFDPATNPNETVSLTNVELIIDKAIDFISSETETSIPPMDGTVGSKTVTVTRNQNAAIALLLPVMLKEAKYKISTSGSLGPLSASVSVGSQDSIFKEMFWKAIERLKERDWSQAII